MNTQKQNGSLHILAGIFFIISVVLEVICNGLYSSSILRLLLLVILAVFLIMGKRTALTAIPCVLLFVIRFFSEVASFFVYGFQELACFFTEGFEFSYLLDLLCRIGFILQAIGWLVLGIILLAPTMKEMTSLKSKAKKCGFCLRSFSCRLF